ncbi:MULTISPECIES: 3-hydroxyacyl-ACP dehydratase FabZ family protein [Xanthobacter]|uniref:3-hydroxyacyl-ACP dehydratase FabZ family protein n=1 Tax=Xanthobacter TaxID=279 RepID=UPI00145C846F|nr:MULTISPECIES: 3-hydroxyacyl-ACP dehydratase FabZ family protein [Xanthobacter]MBN8918327.1 beta-hydroxyacyl-ACP dehydratase [Hyphomicrobiales bacterium]NMN58090.1 3-hydroxyacyl-[acyl-carrier-protein] dehydratase [Xanthobacter sp. SG618]UDQ90324.1 beta-hydroxyacyl-ACP dehydratase [Xanthobacter autotrophicus]UJX44619.1 beta-hydroxyacyl-ACP dehydratase [Xanthobacter sp. YC-JY1]
MRPEVFKMIDRVVAIDPSLQKIHCQGMVPEESSIFEGHFPGYPIMPGVLLIEAMAQTTGWLVLARNRFEKMPFLATVKEAKLRTFVLPGQNLDLYSEILHEGSGFVVAKTNATLEGKPICSAELTFRVLPWPEGKMKPVVMKVAEYVSFPLADFADA